METYIEFDLDLTDQDVQDAEDLMDMGEATTNDLNYYEGLAASESIDWN